MEAPAQPNEEGRSELQFIADAAESHRHRGRKLERAHYLALAFALVSTALSALSAISDGEVSTVLSLLGVSLAAVGVDLALRPLRKAQRHHELSAVA